MALTPQQLKTLEEAKKQGLTREQAMARVFMPTVTPRDTGRFADAGEDLKTGAKSLWQSVRQRTKDIQDTTQNPSVIGNIASGGNIPGLASDIVTTGVTTAAKLFMKPEEEEAVGNFVSGAVEKTGIPQAIANTSPETQKNIRQGSGYLELLGGGLFSKLRKPKTPGAPETPTAPATTPTAPTAPTAPATPLPIKNAEQIGETYVSKLRTQANDPNLSPRAQAEAAQASLTFREQWIGLRPDEKKRLQEMGEAKITEYLDATHLRNMSDTPTPDSPLPPNVWGPQELGNYNVTQAFDKLNSVLGETGSEIGKTRAKLATVKLEQPQVDVITQTFASQIDSLGLAVKNGKIVELPNKIAKTTGSDLNAIQSLYDDFLKFKQSPTIENAYALRTNFDAKIKFGQSARDVSNAVDPLSRSMRSAIAGESAKVIGKESAGELKKYSDFMDAYGDLKAYTDRAAGSEYLLRLVLSGRGREARDLVDTIKTHTGIDLMNDATAMKIAVERFANENQQNLFKQEVTRAGYDIAQLFKDGPTGMVGKGIQLIAEYGIDEETVIKAAASGLGGYLIMSYYGEDGLAPAGIAVLGSMSPQIRKQALKQADEVAKATGKTLKLTEEMRQETLDALMKSDSMTTARTASPIGGETIDMADFDTLELFKELAEKPKGLTDMELIEARAILAQYMPLTAKPQ